MAIDVGILAVEFYSPNYFVDQTALEVHDNVSQGKYTVGLGQKRMAFCSDVEDVNSMCLTVVSRLLSRSLTNPCNIGRLEVGTETVADKSKSIKSVVMQIFESAGNLDIEGADCINACYGGTQALFNAVNWLESTNWDGRLAVVVMTDIACYAEGPARCTGGAGAVALLIGPNAPLVFDSGVRAFDMRHVYDFYKPDPHSEYPIVDGKLSVDCYTKSLDNCFQLYKKKAKQKLGAQVTLDSFSGLLFHAPYCKLVQKSVARLKFLELLTDGPVSSGVAAVDSYLDSFRNRKTCSPDTSDSYKAMEKSFVELSQSLFQDKTKPSLLLAEQIGNMYTSSLYGCLISFLLNKPIESLAGTRVLLFSYGSGSCAAMFSLKVSSDYGIDSALRRLVTSLSHIHVDLNRRTELSPERFVAHLKQREEAYGKAPYKPSGSISDLMQGTYYLDGIDDLFRRTYKVKSGYFIDNGLDCCNRAV